MRIRSRWTPLVLAALLPLAACGADDAETDAEPMEEAAPAAPAADAGMMEPMTIELASKNESSVMGEATATHHADSVAVEVSIEGAAEDGEYPAHIHSGTCAEPGSPIATLTSLQVTEGTGMSSTELAASEVPQDQGAVIQVHDPSGQAIACGDLMGHGGDDMEGMDHGDTEGEDGAMEEGAEGGEGGEAH